MFAILEWTKSNVQQNIEQLQTPNTDLLLLYYTCDVLYFVCIHCLRICMNFNKQIN